MDLEASPRLSSKKRRLPTKEVHGWKTVAEGAFQYIFCIWVTDCRCNTRSTIRQLTVRNVHVLQSGMSVFVGPQLSVKCPKPKKIVGPRLLVEMGRSAHISVFVNGIKQLHISKHV